MAGQIIFISGGARSGKSSYAENYARELARISGQQLFYIATSHIEDEEMEARVLRHQQDRKTSGVAWHTIEQPQNIDHILERLSSQSIVLLDCVTLLITNELFEDGFSERHFLDSAFQKKVINKIMSGLRAIAAQAAYLVIVSNEVLFEVFEDRQSVSYIYQKVIGEVHQKIVSMADQAYAVEFGITREMK